MIFQKFCNRLFVPEGWMMKTLTKMGFNGKDLKTAQIWVIIPSFTPGSCDIRHYAHLPTDALSMWVLFLFV